MVLVPLDGSIPPPSALRRRWMSAAKVRKTFSTLSEFFALVSRKEIFREEAKAWERRRRSFRQGG